MVDPVLGALVADPNSKGCLVASIPFEGRQIDLVVGPDDVGMDACISRARELALSLNESVAKAIAVAAGQLLEEYNRNWRQLSRSRPDGSMEEIENPEITEAEFIQRLHLVSVSVEGALIEFCFGDGGLFAGHSIFVSSFDGLALQDADAMLFG